MTKIDGNEVIHSETLIVPDEKEAIVEFTNENWAIKIILTFHLDETNVSNYVGLGQPDGFRVTFNNWKNPLGTTIAPVEFAKTHAGISLFLQVFHERLGVFNRVTLQVYKGASRAQ